MKADKRRKGEFTSVAQANGGLENMINPNCKDKDLLALIKYIAEEDKQDKVLENPIVAKHMPADKDGVRIAEFAMSKYGEDMLYQEFGKNAVLKDVSYTEGATAKERNGQIGGHKA